jgi:macrolide transport system ATP-binding/permease protein
MIHDLRYAWRMFRNDWAFTVVAVLSLALGTGANSTMFSVVNGLLLRPLPVTRPHEVLTIAPKDPDNVFGGTSWPDYVDFRDNTKTMHDLVAFTLYRFGFSSSSDALPQVKYGMMVSGNLFEAMGVTPMLGRAFRPDEYEVPGRDAVVVLGYDFWKDAFGADPEVIGRTIRLNGIDFTVIGVAPESFTGMDEFFKVTMYVPAMMIPRFALDPNQNLMVNRDWRDFVVKGRLRPGVTAAQAEAELVSIAKGLEETYPATNKGETVTIRTESEMHVLHLPRESSFMFLSMVMGGLVLLISCFNVATLLLSRARSREVAVRLAMGAGRWRLVRQLLTESLLLGTFGVVAGLWFAWAADLLFNRIKIPSDLPFMIDIQPDGRVLLFSLIAGILSVVFFGFAPALQSSKLDLVSSLKASGNSSRSGPRRLWGRNLLVVAQIAISVVLLVVAMIVYRGFSTQFSAGTGFQTDRLLMMTFDPRLVRYDNDQIKNFYDRLIEQAAIAPGVKSVSLAATVPFAMNQRAFSINVVREGYQYSDDEEKDNILYDVVDERFFETLGVPIVSGRGFQKSDDADASPVAVVNEILANKYWPGDNPVGKRLLVEPAPGMSRWVEVVGVARAGKYVSITEEPAEYLYLPLAQSQRPQRVLVVAALGDPAALTATLREVVRGLDSNMPLYDVRTMDEFFSQFVNASSNTILYIIGSMGVMGLVLAMIGLYGLVAYSTSRRTREFGIRMAIGARAGGVLRMVLAQGLTLCLAGLILGLIASLPAGGFLRSFIYTATADWTPYFAVPILLMLVAVLATYAPARRAARIDPMKALRDE